MRYLILLSFLFLSPAVFAQSGVGIGAQVGSPTGVSLKIDSFDFLAGWNLNNDSFFGSVHYIIAQPRVGATTPALRAYYGPGVFVAVRDDDAKLGISFSVGLSYYVQRLEFFGQLSPRFRLIDSTKFELGGGIGFRFYL